MTIVTNIINDQNKINKLFYDTLNGETALKFFIPFIKPENAIEWLNQGEYTKEYVIKTVEFLKEDLIKHHGIFERVIQEQNEEGIFLCLKLDPSFSGSCMQYDALILDFARKAVDYDQGDDIDNFENLFNKEWFVARVEHDILSTLYRGFLKLDKFDKIQPIISYAECNLKEVYKNPTPNLDNWNCKEKNNISIKL